MTWDEQRHATCEAGGIACDCYPCLVAATKRHEDRIRAEARREALREAMTDVESLRLGHPFGEFDQGWNRAVVAMKQKIEALMAKEGP